MVELIGGGGAPAGVAGARSQFFCQRPLPTVGCGIAGRLAVQQALGKLRTVLFQLHPDRFWYCVVVARRSSTASALYAATYRRRSAPIFTAVLPACHALSGFSPAYLPQAGWILFRQRNHA